MNISEDEFNDIVAKTKMQNRSIKFAYDVLIGGLTIAEVAKKYDVPRQIVSSAKKRVLNHRYKIDGIPEDWKEVYCKLPEDLSKAVRWLYDDLRYRKQITITKPPPAPRLERSSIDILIELLKQQ